MPFRWPVFHASSWPAQARCPVSRSGSGGWLSLAWSVKIPRQPTRRPLLSPASLLIPDLDSENPYDLPRALDRALTSFVRLVNVQGGWLAIRRGESLEVRAQWNAPACADLVVSIEANPLLRRVSLNLSPIVVHRDDGHWEDIPHRGLKASTRLWACLPLVIGQRLIGALVLWRSNEFKRDEWNRLIDMTTQVAPSVETIITFAEMAGHLRRLGMLNDFALTVSTGRNLEQIARRVFALLSRAFSTELIGLYLLSSDNRLLTEYRNSEGSMVSSVQSADEHIVTPLLKQGQKVRLGENHSEVRLPLYEKALSGLYVPLRFRGQTIGILCLESPRLDAFSMYDESLMTVIASHLASLADYTRLREEAEGRARNLGLIHEVVQQVIGLTDPRAVAEITSELLARYFAYELAAVFIADEKGELTIGGFGGTSQSVVKRAMRSFEYPVEGGNHRSCLQDGGKCGCQRCDAGCALPFHQGLAGGLRNVCGDPGGCEDPGYHRCGEQLA